jgi:hypothetical protein
VTILEKVVKKLMRNKILELFDYRRFSELISLIKVENSEELLEKLIQLQTDIYHLDQLLESKWEIATEEFDVHWETIGRTLLTLGIPAQQHENYLANIKTYLRHEMWLREGVNPTDLDLEEYYYYKSCDVQLIRRILLENGTVNGDNQSNEDWRYFDYITEVNDDVADIVEDHDSINGNGVVFYIEKYELEEASKILTGFVHASMAAQQEITMNDSGSSDINSWTKAAGEETIQLISSIDSVLKAENIYITDNKTIQLANRALSIS